MKYATLIDECRTTRRSRSDVDSALNQVCLYSRFLVARVSWSDDHAGHWTVETRHMQEKLSDHDPGDKQSKLFVPSYRLHFADARNLFFGSAN